MHDLSLKNKVYSWQDLFEQIEKMTPEQRQEQILTVETIGGTDYNYYICREQPSDEVLPLRYFGKRLVHPVARPVLVLRS